MNAHSKISTQANAERIAHFAFCDAYDADNNSARGEAEGEAFRIMAEVERFYAATSAHAEAMKLTPESLSDLVWEHSDAMSDKLDDATHGLYEAVLFRCHFDATGVNIAGLREVRKAHALARSIAADIVMVPAFDPHSYNLYEEGRL